MTITKPSIQTAFARNSAQEIGHDVWEQFVIPPYYDRLDLTATRKPQLIVGGRGCGKTMLLRYLSHHSLFSPARPSIPDDALSRIGLYWRVDTQFASLMWQRTIPDDVWRSAFSHLVAVKLGLEILQSLDNLVDRNTSLLQQTEIDQLDFSRLQAYDPETPPIAQDLHKYFQRRRGEFESWLNYVRSLDPPRFLPGKHFILQMIAEIRTQLPNFNKAIYFV